MIAAATVIMVAALIAGIVTSGWKSAAAYIVVGMFLAYSTFGLAVKNGLVTGVKSGGSAVTSITNGGR